MLPEEPGEEPTSRDVLTKLSPNDKVMAYLDLFETARPENWPVVEWWGILGPFLTGEVQQAYLHLPEAGSWTYECVEEAILAHYGYSLVAQAQCYHQWAYDSTLPSPAGLHPSNRTLVVILLCYFSLLFLKLILGRALISVGSWLHARFEPGKPLKTS